MSDKIDQRIVEMSFENKKFEKGIAQSKNSLSEFNNALKHGVKGDFTGLDKSVSGLSGSFSAFREIAVGALRQIGVEAVRAGANMIKSLAIEPITQGFNEMELKMNSTQVIMASTGETLATVNGYLEELNEYSDKTIYSFSDMTRNIGKFTNAGVKLDAAVASIKGISNAAALAGANSDEASRAMYNFAQALSSGYVKLIDWKSIELANMATVEFKQQLLDAAVAAGTLTKNADGMYKVLTTGMGGKSMEQAISATRNFNDSLSTQWMTTEVLTATLAAYADETTDIGKRAAQAATQVTTFTKLMETLKEAVGSGWARTFELIFGDFYESRDLWTGINNAVSAMIDTMADARNSLLVGGLGSGWKQLMKEGISDTKAFENTLAVVASEAGIDIDKLVADTGSMEKAVKGYWLTGDMVVETVSRMTASIENLSEEELRNAGYTEKTKAELIALRDAFLSGAISAKDFAAKIGQLSGRDNIIQGLKNSAIALLKILKPISEAFDQIFPPMTANRLFGITKTFKDFTKTLIITEETANKIKRTFAGVFAVLDVGWQTVKFLGSAALEVIKIFIPLGNSFLGASASLGDFLVRFNKIIKSSQVFQYGLLAIKVGVALLRQQLTKIISVISNFVHGLWTAEDPLEYLRNAGERVFGGIVKGIKMATSWISGKFSKAIKGVAGIFDGTFDESAVGIWPTMLRVLRDVVEFIGGKAATSFKGFGNAIKNLDFRKITTFVVGGVLILFVKQLSDLTGSMAGLTHNLSTTVRLFNDKLFGKKKTNLIRDLALALAVLTASIWVLSRIPADDLKRSLIALAAGIGIFVAAYALLQTINVASGKLAGDAKKNPFRFNLDLVGVAVAVAIMAGAVKTISKVDESQVWKSTLVLGALLGFITAYQVLMALTSKIPGQQKVSMNLFGMSASILVLVGALAILNTFTMNDLKTGLAKMAAMLLVIGYAQRFLALAGRISGGKKASVSILGMAVGIVAMVGVMKLLASVNSRSITQGIGNLALITLLLAGIEVIMGLAGRIGGGKKFRSNILSTELGIAAMVGLIYILGKMKQETIDRGIFNLAKMSGIITGIELLTATAARIAGGAKVQKILGAVTVTLLAFTAVVAILGALDPSIVNNGILALAKMVGIVTAIEILTAVASRIGGSAKMAASLTGIVVAILALTGSIALLSMIDQESLRGAVTSLAIASVAIVALSFAMKNISNAVNTISKGSKGFGKQTANIGLALLALGALLVATAAFFGVLALVLPTIKQVEWKDLAIFTIGIGAIAALMVVLDRIPMVAANFVDRLLGLIPAFVAVGAVVLGTWGLFEILGKVLPIVKKVDWNEMGKFAAGIGIVTALIGVIALLGPAFDLLGVGIGPILLGIIAAIAGVALIVAATVGLAFALEALIGEHGAALTKGLDFLVEIGAGIGRFVGAMISGLVGGALEGLALSLVGFADALNKLSFSSEALQGIKALAEAILIISGASILDGIGRFLNFGKSSMQVFGEQLAGLITAINLVNPDLAKQASDTMSALAPMAENLKTLANAAKDIPNSGGFIGRFLGNNDIDEFGTMLAEFIVAFTLIDPLQATHAGDVLAAMKPMVDNLKLFASAAKDIPNSGGFIERFLGNNDIDKFGIMLVDFIDAFAATSARKATHSSAVLAAMTPMAANLDKFALAAQNIPSAGGFVGVFLGTVDLETFSGQVRGLVESFGSIDMAQLGIAVMSLNMMTNFMLPALTKFSDFADGIKGTGGLKKLWSGDSSLSNFGTEISLFIDELSYINVDGVQPALTALEDIVTSFEKIGADVLENAMASFETNKVPFQAAIAAILDEPTKKVNAQKKVLGDAISTAFKVVLDKGASYIKQFRTLGENIVDGLRIGIRSRQPAAIAAAQGVMSSIVTAANKAVKSRSPSKVFAEIGNWCTLGLANGISEKTKVAVRAGVSMANDLEEGIRDATGVHSLSDIYSLIGEYIPGSLSNGMESMKGTLLKVAEGLGVDTGKITTEGIVDGIAGGESATTAGINSLLEIMMGASGSAAESAGAGIGTGVTDAFQDSITDSTTGIGGSKSQAAVKSELEKLKAIVEERQFYGQITLRQELALYEELRKKYKEGSAERKEIDREIYTRLKTIYETELAYIEGVQQARRNAAEERERLDSEYQKNVADAQADAAQNLADLQRGYDEDTIKARVDADKKKEDEDKSYYESLNSILDNAEQERQRLREEYASHQTSINDKLLADIDAQNRAYEDAVKSRADAIYSSYGLFDAVDVDAEVTGEELLKNLQDQGAALSEWKQALAELASRGVGDALIEELQAMGPASKAQIKALLTLTDAQLTEYVGLFEGKYTFARIKAEGELEGLKNSTSQAIKDINTQAGLDLDNLELAFTDAMSTINTNMADDMTEVKETHAQALAQIEYDLRDALTKLQTEWSQSSSEIQAKLSTDLNNLTTEYNEAAEKVNSDLEKNLEDLTTTYSTTMKEINSLTEAELRKLLEENKTKLAQLNSDTSGKLDIVKNTFIKGAGDAMAGFGSALKNIVPNTNATLGDLVNRTKGPFNAANTHFTTSGFHAASGFAQGIYDGTYQVVNASEYMAYRAIQAAETTLAESSPSKVFKGIGKFVSMGFATGITDYAYYAEEASKKMARGPIAAVSQALADMEESDDWSLTITPVLDLSGIRYDDLAQLLDAPVHLGTTSSNLAVETLQNGSNKGGSQPFSIVNKFDLRGLSVRQESDIDRIATKLYEKQQSESRGRGGRTPIRV